MTTPTSSTTPEKIVIDPLTIKIPGPPPPADPHCPQNVLNKLPSANIVSSKDEKFISLVSGGQGFFLHLPGHLINDGLNGLGTYWDTDRHVESKYDPRDPLSTTLPADTTPSRNVTFAFGSSVDKKDKSTTALESTSKEHALQEHTPALVNIESMTEQALWEQAIILVSLYKNYRLFFDEYLSNAINPSPNTPPLHPKISSIIKETYKNAVNLPDMPVTNEGKKPSTFSDAQMAYTDQQMKDVVTPLLISCIYDKARIGKVYFRKLEKFVYNWKKTGYDRSKIVESYGTKTVYVDANGKKISNKDFEKLPVDQKRKAPKKDIPDIMYFSASMNALKKVTKKGSTDSTTMELTKPQLFTMQKNKPVKFPWTTKIKTRPWNINSEQTDETDTSATPLNEYSPFSVGSIVDVFVHMEIGNKASDDTLRLKFKFMSMTLLVAADDNRKQITPVNTSSSLYLQVCDFHEQNDDDENTVYKPQKEDGESDDESDNYEGDSDTSRKRIAEQKMQRAFKNVGVKRMAPDDVDHSLESAFKK